MAYGRYSFIDIAVLEEVRAEFAAGKALALLSVDLDKVLWANGAGAALFGHDNVESVMGASSDLGFVARRQIAAVPGFPRMGRDRPVMVRLARGTTSHAVAFSVSAVTMPDGVAAILLATMPADDGPADDGPADDGDAAGRVVAGFREAGYFAALIDADAQIEAASDGFSALDIAQETLARLVAEVTHERDRLVKRLIPARDGLIPAGIARLTDDPALHLMIAVDEPIEEIAPALEEDDVPEIADDVPAHEMAAPSDADLPERIDEIMPASVAGPEAAIPENDSDNWYFADADERAAPATDAADAIQPADRVTANLAAGPVRFSWRTDARGTISAVSREFIEAVGSDTADVIGHPLHQVIVKFGLDPQDEIKALLERRDTWSGRTVMWPVSGTELVAPVDLAALPVYNRDRVFEGFRGFGVVRMGDAIADPHRRGLTYGQLPDPPASSGQILPDDAPANEIETPPAHSTDPLEDEEPADPITQQASQRFSDIVIRLAEHRPARPKQDEQEDKGPQPKHRLSAVERSAFEEIRERLQRDTNAVVKGETAKDEAEKKEARSGEAKGITAAEEPQLASVEDVPEPAITTAAASEPATDMAPLLELPDHERRTIISPELVSALPLPLLVHAGDVLHFANRQFLDLTGYASLEQIRDEGGLDQLFVEQPPDKATEADGRKLWLRRQDGEAFPVEAHLQSVGWQEGTALLLALQRVAIEPPSAAQPQERAPGELEQHLAELRTIIDTATDGVVLIAPDGTIRNISRPAEALFGFDSAEVEGSHFVTLLAIESRKPARDYLASLADNGVASLLNDGREVIGREREGRFIPLFMTIGRLPGDSGYCAVVRDITQFKRAEEEMTQARAQAERASLQKSDFLARVSHEIRTPLNAIIGFSELMMDEKFGPIGSDRYRDYLRDINRSGNHVLDLVNDLLDISKIEAGEQEMNYEAVSLNEALAEVVAMMQPQANRERVIIRSSLASSLPEIVADLRSVRQIALNLLSNAIRYTHAGGQVIVSTAHEISGDVVLRVRDTGIGMTLAEIDQALKPFKQINALRRGRHDGTGLGLPLTRAMVEANRARFAISSAPGEGTLVEIVFPSTRVLAG